MTGRLVGSEHPDFDFVAYLTLRDLERATGLAYSTLRTYRRDGRLPPEDAPGPRWRPDTIRQWLANRPGQGVGGGRPRKTA